MSLLTPEQIREEVLGYSVKELIDVVYALSVASQEAMHEHGDDVDTWPPALKKYVQRFAEVADERGF